MDVVEHEDDDDEEIFHLYENAHWYWDDQLHQLMFQSDIPEVSEDAPLVTGILGSVEFRQDIDLHEQQRFRKYIQRKYGPDDVVTLQDVKDVVLFTAPLKILLPVVIKLLHLAATERLMRALLLYCSYYLQVTDLMKARHAEELEGKIRTQKSIEIENGYRQNLECLRLLIGKEYSAYIIGSGEFAKYHHMGIQKKTRSLLKKERLIFETFVRIIIQIVWIALGRKKYKQIELEVHRIFKSHKFNLAQHKLERTLEHEADLSERVAYILNGSCIQKKKKINTMSPIMNEVHCVKEADYRLYGLGVVRYPRLNARLEYLADALTLPEASFKERGVCLGILGSNRDNFDIMLNEITRPAAVSEGRISSKMILGASNRQTSRQKKVNVSTKSSGGIKLPPQEEIELLDKFPHETLPTRQCEKVHRHIWLRKVMRKHKTVMKQLTNP